MHLKLIILVLAGLLAGLPGCSTPVGINENLPAPATPDLAAHSTEFKQEVIRVTDGVYVAVGFGLANSILLEGDDGVVIVDTMESAEAAVAVKAAFDRITTKPVKAIIYTHFHADHVFGTKVLAGGDKPDIYAYAGTAEHLNRVLTITRETTYRRAMRQFGTLLPEEDFVNAGIGPRLDFDEKRTPAIMFPNKTFDQEKIFLTIAGLRLVLVHAPGETPDQIFIWLPDKRVLLPADNFYKSFPNLYAIRGTTYRDVMKWVGSLDKMRRLKAEYLVPQHTRPLIGSEKIYDTLTNYRDAIQYVHDQTIRLMNAGLGRDDIVQQVKLPTHLARQPYLQQYYGTVAWSVRAILEGYLGWFSGNSTDLFPMAPVERARRVARLAGGAERLLQIAEEAAGAGDYQWALELSDYILLLPSGLTAARELRAEALAALGQDQAAATARNYYLTQSLEADGRLVIGGGDRVISRDLLARIPLGPFFASMAVRLDPVKSADVDTIAGFRFPDTGEAYTVHVRRGVAEIQPRLADNPDISLTVDSLVWKEVAAGLRNPAVALVKDVDKEGGILEIVRFLRLFETTRPDTG